MGEDYKFIIVMNGKAIEPTNREDILRARYALVDKFYIRNDGNDVVVLIDCSESPKYMIV